MAKWQIGGTEVGYGSLPQYTDINFETTKEVQDFMFGNALDDYQKECLKLAIFPKDKALVYLGLKLAGEAGEVAEKIGKNIRDGGQLDDLGLAKELGDVMWYVAVLAEHLGYDLSEIADMNIKKLNDRKERGKLSGSGDNR